MSSTTETRLRLFTGQHLPLVLGVIGLVTLGAFENRAVGTALPTMVREFDALGSFGLANAAPSASYLISLAIAGLWSDRRGPIPTLRAGAISFALAQLLVGTATGMPMVVTGRLLSGLAEGLLDVSLMVLVARALPAVLRPRMFSLFAAMWILPSVLGPVLTGVVTEQFGWRWVFLGAVVLLIPSWLLLGPAMRQSATAVAPERTAEDIAELAAWRAALPWALAASVALFSMTLAGDHLEAHPFLGGTAVVVAVAVLARAAVRVMPAGLFVARRGFPAVVAVRALGGVAFTVAGAYLPLLLTLQHHFSPSRAGVTLSITGVCWAFGSWLQGRDHGIDRVTVLRIGLAFMTLGLLVTSLLAWTAATSWIALVGWGLGGIGMGLSSSSLSVLTLDLSDHNNSGRNSSAGQMATTMSVATGLAISGTLLAFNADNPRPWVFGSIITAGAVLALLAFLAAPRSRRA
ncbi:MFS transporter [Kribbella sp. NBC_00709]|uniref:MFS transporter n=1 Tax=Kribbella sp. NBC_00709 TaxID=2975972 RepID=UPI002E2A92C8|nr:MFS transporter [Kribbella sp. NBC_00709]